MSLLGVKGDGGVTRQQSQSLIKNMLRLSISSICYHRELFSHSSFTDEVHEGGKDGEKSKCLHILSSSTDEFDDDGNVVGTHIRDEKAFLLTQWLERGVFDAIEHGYLSSLQFAIFTQHPETKKDLLLETYEFKLAYPSADNPAMINDTPITKKTMKKEATRFVRSLITFSHTLDELPEERWITLQLEYNSKCPADYEPEFFKSAPASIVGFDGTASWIKIRIGSISSDHHKLSVKYSGLENLKQLVPTTPLTAAAKAKLQHSGGLSVASSSFKGVNSSSAVPTPQEKHGAPPPVSSIAASLNQLLLSQQASTSGGFVDDGSDCSKVHAYLYVLFVFPSRHGTGASQFAQTHLLCRVALADPSLSPPPPPHPPTYTESLAMTPPLAPSVATLV